MNKPCNPKASQEAVALLAYLYSIRGHKTLIAAHDYIGSGTDCYHLAKEIADQYPAIWGSDFSFLYRGETPSAIQHCGPMNVTVSTPAIPREKAEILPNCDPHTMRMCLVESATRLYERGCWITLMWHSAFPTYGDEGPDDTIWTLKNPPSWDVWRDLTTEGTSLHKQWMAQVDRIASYLRILRDRKIPVLWRPYHEMNGVWFWWCNKPGRDGYERLWRQMYCRFVDHHQLDNLLWVWNAHAPRNKTGDEAYAYQDFYPGHDCVDILAADIYNNDFQQSHHDDLLRLGGGKPIAIGELEGLPAPEIFSNQKEWLWFMPWGKALIWKMNDHERTRALYNHPRCLGREDIRK